MTRQLARVIWYFPPQDTQHGGEYRWVVQGEERQRSRDFGKLLRCFHAAHGSHLDDVWYQTVGSRFPIGKTENKPDVGLILRGNGTSLNVDLQVAPSRNKPSA